MSTPDEILDFWLGPLDAEGLAAPDRAALWFSADPVFDARVRSRFLDTYREVVEGRSEDWLATPRGRLAYVIVLDQFSRNMFRGSAQMFTADPVARRVVHDGLADSIDEALAVHERVFLYMPLMHSEELADQERCVELFRALAEGLRGRARQTAEYSLDYAVRHRDIIARFGRFPHRNQVLGRPSTEEELAFLKQPGSSF